MQRIQQIEFFAELKNTQRMITDLLETYHIEPIYDLKHLPQIHSFVEDYFLPLKEKEAGADYYITRAEIFILLYLFDPKRLAIAERGRFDCKVRDAICNAMGMVSSNYNKYKLSCMDTYRNYPFFREMVNNCIAAILRLHIPKLPNSAIS